MKLTKWEERALKGEMGEGLRLAMELLVGIAKLTGAESFIPIVSAHISGVNYANIGDAGLEFLEDLSRKARVSVLTTINPAGIDFDMPDIFGQPRDFIDGQRRIVGAFKKMGAKLTLSCIPYELENVVHQGSHVAWAESSAVVYANSVLGLRTNRESGLSALAAAVAGRTPLSGLHLDENRRPSFYVKVETELHTPTDFGLLGYWSAKLTDRTIGYIASQRPGKAELKQLSAAIGTAGASGMFVWGVDGTFNVTFGEAELNKARKELSVKKEGEIIFIGCPFVTLSEFEEIARMVKGRKFLKPAYLFTSRSVYEKALELGFVRVVEESGVKIFKDICPALTPIVRYMDIGTVITPSVKASHYLKVRFSSNVVLKSLNEILKEFSE